jgi:hypothetical protein
MTALGISLDSLEEQVLRILFESPASARECATALSPYARVSTDRILEIENLIDELTRRSFLAAHVGEGALRYYLTPTGSARLADLVE